MVIPSSVDLEAQAAAGTFTVWVGTASLTSDDLPEGLPQSSRWARKAREWPLLSGGS
jgi:hypothetical protein